MRTEQECLNLEAELALAQLENRGLKQTVVEQSANISRQEALIIQCAVDATERDALAAQLQEMREALQAMVDYAREEGKGLRMADKALATPDTSAQILARLKAAIWMEAAELYANSCAEYDAIDFESVCRAKHDELLKGLEKEHG